MLIRKPHVLTESCTKVICDRVELRKRLCVLLISTYAYSKKKIIAL